MRAFADGGFILTLSDYKVDLASAGLELGVSGQVLESYHKKKWVTIGADTPTRVCQGGIVAIRVKGVYDLCNWDIDKNFIA